MLPNPRPRIPLPEGIGHDLRELTGEHAKVRPKPARQGVGEDVDVVPLHADLFDFHAKPSGVAAMDAEESGKRRRMAKAPRKRVQVHFENDMHGVARRERASAASVTRFA